MANDFLVTYLDSIDEDLLDYLDEDDHLAFAWVRRLRDIASNLLAGTVTASEVMGEWPEVPPGSGLRGHLRHRGPGGDGAEGTLPGQGGRWWGPTPHCRRPGLPGGAGAGPG